MTYKRTLECEAIQYDGDNIEELEKLLDNTSFSLLENRKGDYILSHRGHSIEVLDIGEWLVRYENDFVGIMGNRDFEHAFTKSL